MLKHAQVFGDGLAGEPRSSGQLRDGARLSRTELFDEDESGPVAEGREENGVPRASDAIRPSA